jgi:hypothetical protein
MANETRRFAGARPACVESVLAAGPAGIDTVTLARRHGLTRDAITKALHASGECILRRTSRNTAGVWVHASHAPAPEHAMLKPPAKKRPTSLNGAEPAIMTDRTRRVVVPPVRDFRFTVRVLPADYVSQLDSNECRGWAKVVAK